MPKEYVAESLLEAFEGDNLNGVRILLPRAAIARDLVPAEFKRRGAIVDVAEAYQTVPPESIGPRAKEVLARKPDWITFTSSSTVKNLVGALKPLGGIAALEGVRTVSIGPITSATMREYGLNVDAEANPHTNGGLVEALLQAERSRGAA
jgi:uroporphyrinogen-III synthase